MKVVILAGGLGTRLSEETSVRPKPMAEIGGKPILWHIMKSYSFHGINEFIICLGYKGYFIKEYFANYFLHMSNVTFDMTNNNMEVHENSAEPWRVTLIDTGDSTMTGGRIKRIQQYVGDESFCMTYGDGVGDVDITKLVELHHLENRLATVTAVRPAARFGSIEHKEHRVTGFKEKPIGESGWINGGFFVLSPKIFDYISGDNIIWEQEPMRKLAKDQQMSVYFHEGFWMPMDTLREKNQLEELWHAKKAPWKVW